MSKPPQRGTQRTSYTGETIVMPRRAQGTAPPKPTRSLWWRFKLILLAIAGLLLLGLVLLYLQVHSIAKQIVVEDVRPNAPIASPLLGGVNVLIVGVDERKDNPQEGVRSDTMILAHIDALGRWVNLLSVPRDTQVDLPDVGASKINAAYGQGYAFAEEYYGQKATPREGGMALTAETLSKLLPLGERGQRIHFIAQVNFEGFAKIIDALGGITIDVPKYILDEDYPTEDFQTMRVEFQPGVQRMDGATALIYARTRHGDSDFERGARQQQVIRAIISELRERSLLGKVLSLPRLLGGLEGTVATTMPIDRLDVLLAMTWLAGGLDVNQIGQVRLSPEIDPDMQEDGSNLIWSAAGVRAAVTAFLASPDGPAETATIQVLNATDVPGLAGKVSLELEHDGYRMLPADNAPITDAAQTVVYDLTGKPVTSRRLASALGAQLQRGTLPEGITSNADVLVVLGRDAANR